VDIRYRWRGEIDSVALEALHGVCFDHDPVPYDWAAQLEGHSLGWVTAVESGELIGFVNLAWDGAGHAFILDTVVAPAHRRVGVGTRLVEIATEHARSSGCEWLHVDYDEHLREFYEGACGFAAAPAGVMRL
jgi:ribosomal protein S18 acetylase RimI-like enzyme